MLHSIVVLCVLRSCSGHLWYTASLGRCATIIRHAKTLTVPATSIATVSVTLAWCEAGHLAQVRSVGKNNPLTKQPIKGRKAGGGIRFGEMERDSLLAHGAAYLLHDRLHYCSDYHVVDVCASCGSMLALRHRQGTAERLLGAGGGVAVAREDAGARDVTCGACGEGRGRPERVAMPYVFKYLVTELAVMNVKVTLGVA
jgi:DNA-directed RNA polymerase beta subunit